MKKILIVSFLFLGLSVSSWAQFKVTASVKDGKVLVSAKIPPKHYLYVTHFKVLDGLGNEQVLENTPESSTMLDQITGKPKPVYKKSFEAVYAWKPTPGGEGSLKVEYMGCDDNVCFMSEELMVKLAAVEAPKSVAATEEKTADWKKALEGFEVEKTGVGYKNVAEFISFLGAENVANAPEEKMSFFRRFTDDPAGFLRESGVVWTLLLILLGGFLLNLTPCVLPMIPINLAIIGAGAQAGSKKRGFALGGVYGLGIALAYGLLGVVVVLTGSQFGSIQSNPWFNLGIALIFVVLALAMFDVLQIDFSRFQNKMGGNKPKKQGSFLVAFSMGAVAALLAGACVAPVVIAVLALAGQVYLSSPAAGLSLLFVLGIGMGLPWPFAGAGLSFLPKPGKWMTYVKYIFGVGIILFAVYYGHLSFKAFTQKTATDMNAVFAQELLEAKKEGKPVFIDFGASWCKNCKAMEETTFKDAAVQDRLKKYHFIHYQAEDPSDPQVKAVSEYFNVKGLPTYVVLRNKN